MSEAACDLDSSIPDWIIEYPETLTVFQEFAIDYSCGGKSLDYACRERGIDPEKVYSKLIHCLRSKPSGSAT